MRATLRTDGIGSRSSRSRALLDAHRTSSLRACGRGVSVGRDRMTRKLRAGIAGSVEDVTAWLASRCSNRSRFSTACSALRHHRRWRPRSQHLLLPQPHGATGRRRQDLEDLVRRPLLDELVRTPEGWRMKHRIDEVFTCTSCHRLTAVVDDPRRFRLQHRRNSSRPSPVATTLPLPGRRISRRARRQSRRWHGSSSWPARRLSRSASPRSS